MPSLETKVNIIGGGIVGCIQAIELKLLGYEVSIYEKNTIGMGSTWAGGGIIFPLLPHHYKNGCDYKLNSNIDHQNRF